MSQCWLSSGFIAIGTSIGTVKIFDTEKLVETVTLGNIFNVRAVKPLRNGFVCAGENRKVIFFNPTNRKTKLGFSKINELVLPETDSYPIIQLALDRLESFVYIITQNNNVLGAATLDLVKPPTDGTFSHNVKLKTLMTSFHHGKVTCIDTCIRKPIIVSSATDKSVRIYNFLKGSYECIKYFPEEPHSVALHPSGLYLLIGFADKLRFMSVVTGDMRMDQEYAIRGCRDCRFSNGGHLFAAAHGNNVQIFKTWTFESVGALKGHRGKIKSLAWSADDSKLITSGSDGAVYTWSSETLKRENEFVLKGCGFTSAVCSANGNSAYAVGSDRTLKVYIGMIIRKLSIPRSPKN